MYVVMFCQQDCLRLRTPENFLVEMCRSTEISLTVVDANESHYSITTWCCVDGSLWNICVQEIVTHIYLACPFIVLRLRYLISSLHWRPVILSLHKERILLLDEQFLSTLVESSTFCPFFSSKRKDQTNALLHSVCLTKVKLQEGVLCRAELENFSAKFTVWVVYYNLSLAIFWLISIE